MTRSNKRSWLSIAAFAFAAPAVVLFGCSGPPVPTTISGEPICADYTIGVGGAKMRGGLRYPVRVTVLDDDDPEAKALIYGKRSEGDPSPRIMLPNKNAEYKVQWSQCVNERATVPVGGSKAKSLRTDSATSYDCGESTVYKTDTLVTKKGDPASHAIAYQAPPKPECWTDAKPEAAAAADAGAPDAAPAATDVADAEAPDASVADAEAADAGATDASSVEDAAAAKEGGDKATEKKADEKAGK